MTQWKQQFPNTVGNAIADALEKIAAEYQTPPIQGYPQGAEFDWTASLTLELIAQAFREGKV